MLWSSARGNRSSCFSFLQTQRSLCSFKVPLAKLDVNARIQLPVCSTSSDSVMCRSASVEFCCKVHRSPIYAITVNTPFCHFLSDFVLSPSPQHLTKPLLAVAFLSSFGSSMLYGYNLAVVNSPAEVCVPITSSTWCKSLFPSLGHHQPL